jgi:hypothetical protein
LFTFAWRHHMRVYIPLSTPLTARLSYLA